MKILIGSIATESSTFNPTPTDLETFKRTQYFLGSELINHHIGKPSELGGMLKVLKDVGVTPVPTICAIAMCSGLVVAKTYYDLKNKLITAVIKEIGQADGLLLSLHGAMSVEGLEDPEGDILASLREVMPASKYIASSLDHHANVTEQMVKNADILVGFRTHPHTDQYQVGSTAATLLLDHLKNRYELKKAFIKLPLMTPAENRNEAIRKLAAETMRIEEVPGIFTASFFVGYPWADLRITGASTLVISKNDGALASKCAAELANLMWGIRREFQFPIHSVADAVKKGNLLATKPIVLNELCDCLFGGAAGDVVTTARYLIDNRVPGSVVLGIVDAAAVKKAAKAGKGASTHLKIGGHTTKEGNPPLEVDCRVELVVDHFVSGGITHPGFETPLGQIAVVSVNDVKLILISNSGKIEGPDTLRNLGIDPKASKFIVSKEGLTTFLTYGSIGGEIMMVDCAGFNRQRFRPNDYKRVHRPIFPLDPDMNWSA